MEGFDTPRQMLFVSISQNHLDDGGDELGRWANRMTDVERNGSGSGLLEAASVTSVNISKGEDDAEDERESDDSPSPVDPSPPRNRELLRGGP